MAPRRSLRADKKIPEGEFHTWTDDEIAAFERGTLARTAFALLFYTGERRSDVVRMARPDVEDGIIHIVQGKTGAKLGLPVHPALAEALTHSPRRGDPIGIPKTYPRSLGNAPKS